MVDEKRKAEMREYQKQRSALRRQHGLVTRTLWIWESDNDSFRKAISPYVDRARLIEAILGAAPMPSLEIIEIIKKHNFPYDPADIVYLADLQTQLALNPPTDSSATEKAREILSRYDLPITVDDLVS